VTYIKPVQVAIPPADLWRLEDAAEHRGLTLADFMYESALSAAGFRRDGEESLVVMQRNGATVKQIAARLNMTNSAVKSRIKRLGLLPVPKKTDAASVAEKSSK